MPNAVRPLPRRALPALALAAAAAWPGDAAAQASFDCRKAREPAEKAICADRELARIDGLVAAAFKAALKRLPLAGAKVLREDQRRFVGLRDWAFGRQDFSLKEFLAYRVTQLESVDDAPRTGYDGAWIHVGGSVTIGRGEAGLEVNLSVGDGAVGRWLCDFSGIARADGKDLIVEEPKGEEGFDGWTLRLSRGPGVLTVAAVPPPGAPAGPPPFCGANGSVDGSFYPARVEMAEPPDANPPEPASPGK